MMVACGGYEVLYGCVNIGDRWNTKKLARGPLYASATFRLRRASEVDGLGMHFLFLHSLHDDFSTNHIY